MLVLQVSEVSPSSTLLPLLQTPGKEIWESHLQLSHQNAM